MHPSEIVANPVKYRGFFVMCFRGLACICFGVGDFSRLVAAILAPLAECLWEIGLSDSQVMFRSNSRTVAEPLADDMNRMMLAQFCFATYSQVVG